MCLSYVLTSVHADLTILTVANLAPISWESCSCQDLAETDCLCATLVAFLRILLLFVLVAVFHVFCCYLSVICLCLRPSPYMVCTSCLVSFSPFLLSPVARYCLVQSSVFLFIGLCISTPLCSFVSCRFVSLFVSVRP